MSFAELFIIALVGIIVVGPNKLPQAIKTCMIWITRIKRIIQDTRTEFEQQIGMDEIRRQIHNEQVMASLRALEEAKKDLRKNLDEANSIQPPQSQTDTRLEKNERPNVEPEEKTSAINIPREDFDNDDHLYGEQRGSHPKEEPPSLEGATETQIDKAPSSSPSLTK